jgi:hypothetical protein
MFRRLIRYGLALLPFLAAPALSDAAVITYDLNCIISGGSVEGGNSNCANGILSPSYGTLTYADNASDPNKVDVTIDLTSNSSGDPRKALHFFFNYDDAKFGNSTSFVFTGDLTTYSIAENAQKPDGYSGFLDIQSPATGNGGFEPITFTIALAGTDLNPADFNFLDTLNKIFAAVHIGNCGPESGICDQTSPGGNSIWVGATPRTTTVPEPTTLLLLGAGLLLVGMARTRTRQT